VADNINEDTGYTACMDEFDNLPNGEGPPAMVHFYEALRIDPTIESGRIMFCEDISRAGLKRDYNANLFVGNDGTWWATFPSLEVYIEFLLRWS